VAVVVNKVAWLLFAMSAVGNVALGALRLRPPPDLATEASTPAGSVSATLPVLTPPRPIGATVGRASCAQRADDLRRRRAELERWVEKFATPKEIFDRSPRGPDDDALADEVRQRLRFGPVDASHPNDIVCRGWVCRITKQRDAGAEPTLDSDWARRNLRKAMGTRSEAYYEIRERGVPSGYDLLERIVDDFKRSQALDRCKDLFGDERATLDVRVDLAHDDGEIDDAPAGLSLRASGSLEGTAAGKCIVDQLRAAFAAVRLPPNYTHGSMLVRLPDGA
jgi:hypothetical protein